MDLVCITIFLAGRREWVDAVIFLCKLPSVPRWSLSGRAEFSNANEFYRRDDRLVPLSYLNTIVKVSLY